MRLISQVEFALLIMCLSMSFASTAEAQFSGKSSSKQSAPQEQKPQKAAALPTKDQPKAKPSGDIRPVKNTVVEEKEDKEIPPELTDEKLQEILILWEKHSSKIKTIHGVQIRIEINHTFKSEKITKGNFYLEMPDKGRIDMIAEPVKKGQQSERKTKEGVAYQLGIAQSERWICTGDTIIQIDETEKTYSQIEIPVEQRGKNIINSPLPFLFGMTAEEANNRFTLSLKENTDEYAMLLVIPRLQKDRQNYKKALVKLSKKTYLPLRVRMLGEEGMENEYRFEGVKPNDKENPFLKLFGGIKDPFHPSLKGYTLVIPQDPADIEPIRATAPRPATKDQKKPTAEATVPNNTRPQRTATGPSSGTMKR